jgi:hypothetical protein
MTAKLFASVALFVLFIPLTSSSQNIEKVLFDKTDSTEGYYLAIVPQSKQAKGVIVLLTSFQAPESLLAETKLHNVAYTNDLLTVVVPMKQKLYADSFAVHRINTILSDIQKRFPADTSKFALGGYDEAGNIALRYTELTYEHPSQYPVRPKAVFGIDTPVDLFGLWHRSERQIKKNFWPGAVGDAQYYLTTMTKENGTIYKNSNRYKALSPFYREDDTTGNEQYLKIVAVRLYYDTDIDWHLKNRRNSLYDTKIPDGSELIKRLLLLGNQRAEFVASSQPGMRNNGTRHPTSFSIVDEVDCIHWIKKSLGIFDPNTWKPLYAWSVLKGWSVEHFSLPPDFAPAMTYRGIEDIRFAPGWGDSTKADYWSYAYLWWLEGTPVINAESLQKNLQLYYTGLVERNIISRKIPENKLVSTTATVKKIKTAIGDLQTFNGSVQMLDYMTQRPMVLNTIIHVKDCDTMNHKAILIKVSPRQYTHAIWKEFDKVEKSYSCDK